MSVRIGVAAVCFVALSGCATTRESVPARLDLSSATCASDVSLAGAAVLVGEKQGAKEAPLKATVRIGDTAPCVDQSGQRSTYQVFALPGGDGLMITVVSVPLGGTLFSPRLQMRDEAGAVTREVGRDVFLFGAGNTLQLQLRLRAGERYAVVLSDPKTVGTSVTNISAGTSASGVPVGTGGYVPIFTGHENSAKLTFAHNGEIVVLVSAIPAADK
jgi:hypothetical protein